MSLKAISNAYPLPNGTVGQVLTMVAGTPPKPDWANSASVPGGTSGQIQINSSGSFAGITIGGDATFDPTTGALTITKTSGVSFANSATTDTTNATNITSGTLAAARMPATAPYYAAAYGVVPGITDCSAALTALLATVNAAGGGTIYFAPGQYTISSNITFPDNGEPSGIKTVNSIMLVGSGAFASGNWGTGALSGGTIFAFSSSSGVAHMKTKGAGLLSLFGITFATTANTGIPILYTTNTTLRVWNCCFSGYGSAFSGTTNNDAIVLGGTDNTANNTDTGFFQGYGTVIKENFFDKCRRLVYCRVACNNVVIRDNVSSSTCGNSLTNGAAIDIDGSGGTSLVNYYCNGISITDNCIETGYYSYVIKCKWAMANYFCNNSIWDPVPGITKGGIYFENYQSGYNVIISTFEGGGPANLPYYCTNTDGSYYNHVFGGNPFLEPSRFLNAAFTGGDGQTTVQPVSVYGPNSAAVLFRVLRAAGEAGAQANAPVLEIVDRGALYLPDLVRGGTANPNNTAIKTDTVEWQGNGATWISTALGGTGGTMAQNSGTGGSYFIQHNYGIQWYDHSGHYQGSWGCGKVGLSFGPGNSSTYANDTGFIRMAAGMLAVNNGTNYAVTPYFRDLTVRSVVTAGDTYANLPSAPVVGQRAFITDSTLAYNSTNLGAIASGGQSYTSPVFYTGTNWVIGG